MDLSEKTKEELIEELEDLKQKVRISALRNEKGFVGDQVEAEMDLEYLLNKTQKRLVKALELMSDGFVCLDKNWIYTYVNQKAGEIFDRDPKDLLGKHIWTEYPEGIGQPFYKNYHKVLETGIQIDFEEYYKPWDRWFENRIVPAGDGIVIFFTDITKKKKTDLKLAEHTRQLEINNQQLIDFCNIVSHNLRAPLVNLAMISELISTDKDDQERDKMINSIKPVVSHLNEVFNELVESLQVRQDLSVKSIKLNIQEVFEQVKTLLYAEIMVSKVHIETDFSEIDTINYPASYLESVLLNLLSNAIKYRSHERRLFVRVTTKTENDNMVLCIEDNGLGLDVDFHKDNLFKIRKVFHEHPEARGFGLFMTKTQVESMGGRVWVNSIPGAGSKFFVELVNQEL